MLQEHLVDDAEFLQIVPAGQDWLLVYRVRVRKTLGYRMTSDPRL